MDEDRWEIQWVREYRQFIVEPPSYATFGNDDWTELSFDTIAEAMNWIEQQLIKAVGDSVVDAVSKVVELTEVTLDGNPFLPPYQPREEPRRVLSDGERARGNRYGVVNPIAEQVGNAEDRRNRLADYQQSVGLQ